MNIFGRAAKVTKETERALRRSAARGNSLAAKSVLDALDILSDTSRKLSLAERIQVDKQIKEGLKQWDIDRFKEYNKPEIDHPLDNIDQTFRGEYADMARHMAGGVLKQGESLADKGSVYVEAKAGAGAILNVPIEAGLNVALEAQARAETALKQLESFAAYCEKGNITEQIANGQAFKKASDIITKGCNTLEEALDVRKILNEYDKRLEKAESTLKQYKESFAALSFKCVDKEITIFKRNDVPYPHPSAVAVIAGKNGTMDSVLLDTEKDIADLAKSENLIGYENWRENMPEVPSGIVDSWIQALENAENVPISYLTDKAVNNQELSVKDLLNGLDREITQKRMGEPIEFRLTDKFITKHQTADMISKNDPDRFAQILDKIAEIEEQLNKNQVMLSDMNVRLSVGILDSKFNLDKDAEKANGEQMFIYLQTSGGSNIRLSYDTAFNPGSVMISDSKQTGISLEDVLEAEKNGRRVMTPYLSVRGGLVAQNIDVSDEMANALSAIKDIGIIDKQHSLYLELKQQQTEKENKEDMDIERE